MLHWLTVNKAWLFDGVGGALLVLGIGKLFRDRATPVQKQRSGANSTNIQSGRDVTISSPASEKGNTDA